MASTEHQQVESMIRAMAAARPTTNGADGSDPAEGQIAMRNMMEATAQPPENFPLVTITEVDAGGVPAEWIVPKEGGDTAKRLLYIHGGAFFMCSPRTHRPITTTLAAETGYAVLSIDYRMMPEHSRLTGFEDCVTAYDWVLENGPDGASSASHVYVAGDSAGGNLTLSLVHEAKQTGRRTPNAAVGIAPLTDGTMSSDSLIKNAPTDAVIGDMIAALEAIPVADRAAAQTASWGVEATDPRVSPIHGDLAGLPPILLHASESECLHDDAARFAEAAKAAGVDVTFKSWPDLMHVWHVYAPNVPEAVDALGEIASFMKKHA